MSRKHIVIDARFLNPNTSGNGRLAYDLLARLLPKKGFRFSVLVPPGQEHALDELLKPEDKAVIAPEPWYSLSEQTSFRRRLINLKPDLVHFLHFNHPLRLKLPFVVTIPDLVLDDYPTPGASRLKRAAYRAVMKDAVKRSKAVLAVSQNTADELVERYRAKRAKLFITPNAVNSLRSPQVDLGTRPSLAAELVEKGVHKPYFLYVGQQRIHKNVDGLIRGFLSFRDRFPEASIYKLVLAGKIDPKSVWVEEALEEADLARRDIIRTGFVSEAELMNIFQNAEAFFFPSLKEGFGLPPLEAMSYGLPVASSDASCLPEVLGEAAIYFDPLDPETIADAMHLLATNDKLSAKLKELGEKQWRKFTWEKTAKLVESVYAEILRVE